MKVRMKRVLIVDDEPTILMTLSHLISRVQTRGIVVPDEQSV